MKTFSVAAIRTAAERNCQCVRRVVVSIEAALCPLLGDEEAAER